MAPSIGTTSLTPALRRAVITSGISVALWSSVLIVEMIGQQPSVSGVAKALVVAVVLAVLLSTVAVPVGGGLLTLVAIHADLGHHDRRAQAFVAALLGLALIGWGLRWLSWVMDPRGNPPGMYIG